MVEIKQYNDPEDFKAALKEAGSKLVIVDFHATWCGPCKMMAPKLEKWAEEMSEYAIFMKVDVDENEDTAQEYDVSAMPTFILFKDGEKVDTVVGASEPKLTDAIEKHK